jgi:hypothetical protein
VSLSPFVILFSVTMFDASNTMENGSVGVSGSGVCRPPSAPNSGNQPVPIGNNNNYDTNNANNNNTPSKAALQMQKMRDANTKYKNLLKMAKERIEQQEEELKKLKGG